MFERLNSLFDDIENPGVWHQRVAVRHDGDRLPGVFAGPSQYTGCRVTEKSAGCPRVTFALRWLFRSTGCLLDILPPSKELVVLWLERTAGDRPRQQPVEAAGSVDTQNASTSSLGKRWV